MAKPKRLNIGPEDRLIGVKQRQKTDLFAGCNEPGTRSFERNAHDFERVYCRVCKNADCIRAKGAISPWQTRMAEQVDYLVNDPQFSDMTSQEHQTLAQMGFDSIREKMERLEEARVRQDWEVPEGPTDGYGRVASPDTTDQFDDAVRALANSRGNEGPELGRPEGTEQPAHFRDDEDVAEDGPEYETDYPSSDGKRTYHIVLSREGSWSCECAGFLNRQKCKHLSTVRAWYGEQVVLAEDQEREDRERERQAARPPPRKPPPGPDPRVPVERPLNTPMPQTGVMIGGQPGPEQPMRQRPPPPRDPWAIPTEKVVEPGATVTLKGDKK